MGTFRALWMLRKETFLRSPYERSHHRRLTTITYVLRVCVHVFLLFTVIVIPLICFLPLFLMQTKETTILFFTASSITSLLGSYVWLAPLYKYLSGNPDDITDDYAYRLHSLSAIHRLNNKLSVLNLELRFEEDSNLKYYSMGKLNLFIKGTDVIPQGTIVTHHQYKDCPKLSLLNVGAANFKSVKVQIAAREFNIIEGFIFTKLWKHVVWKALTFLIVQHILKKDLSEYGPVWFQVHDTKKIVAAVKLGVEPAQFINFLQLDIPVEEYETFKGLPLSWIEKTLNRTLVKA
jgi:hypothetical protein